MESVFSIVSPSFNQAQFLGEAIESVLSQSGEFYIDYVIMDGGSEDDSVNMIRQYEAMLESTCDKQQLGELTYYIPRNRAESLVKCLGVSYRWHSAHDKGQADAINTAMDAVKGNFFAYLNSDDIYAPYAFQQVMDAFARDQSVDVVYGNALFINAESEVTGTYPSKDIKHADLVKQCWLSQPSVFIRMEAVRLAGKFNPYIKNSLDYEYWLRLQSMNAQFKFIAPVLSATRIHGDSKTNLNQKRIKLECLALARHYGGVAPISWRRALVQDSTFPGILSSRILSVMEKLRSMAITLLTTMIYPFYIGKVRAEEQRLFPERP